MPVRPENKNGLMTTPVCNLCGGETKIFGRHIVLGSHPATYGRCAVCGFVQACDPNWLEEAYATPINPMDTGCVVRTWHLARAATAVIGTILRTDGPFLDFGGGYGLFVRHMRDLGFDFRWLDGYCKNLLAAGFEADPAQDGRYGLITSFEVFEHLADPLRQFEQLLQWSDALLFSTELMPENLDSIAGWHFAGLEHGQHISFFSQRSLFLAAKRLGVNVVSNGHSLHLLSRQRVSPAWFRLVVRQKVSGLLQPLLRRPSLTLKDTQRMTAVLRRSHEANERSGPGHDLR
jgi:hypothetical protein